MSETSVIAFRKRDTYRSGVAGAKPWLFGILTRLLSEHARSGRRADAAWQRAGATADQPVDTTERVATQVDATRRTAALAPALTAMNAGDRDVVTLYAWADMSYPEIAAALDIPVGTVRSRLHRARRALRAALSTTRPASSQGTRTSRRSS